MLKLDIGIEFLNRTGASQQDTESYAIWTRRLVGQYSGSSRVSRSTDSCQRVKETEDSIHKKHCILSLTPSSESVKLKPQPT